MPAMAQDSPPSPVVDALQPAAQISLLGLVVGILFGVVIGGAGILTALVLLLRSIMNSPSLVATIEGLVNSVPADKIKIANQAGKHLAEVGEAVQEFTDGVPKASKTA